MAMSWRLAAYLLLVLLDPSVLAHRAHQNVTCSQQHEEGGALARIAVRHPDGHRVEMANKSSSVSAQIVICGDFCRRGCEFREVPREEWDGFDEFPVLQIFHGSTIPEYDQDNKQYVVLQSYMVKLFQVFANSSQHSSSGTVLEFDLVPRLPESFPQHEASEVVHELRVFLRQEEESWEGENSFFWTAPLIKHKTIFMSALLPLLLFMFLTLSARYHHLGLGDHLICSSIIRFYAQSFALVLFAVSINYTGNPPPPPPPPPPPHLATSSEAMKQLFADLPNVVPFLVKDEYQMMQTKESVFQDGNIEFLRLFLDSLSPL
ncbi:hypothetical protein GUITHDRAFT_146029 [Guillardia theta CCMP2712]|uniref:Uncharacterized protein n=1 Tax=Guillardia theta (strain CCMP2712) TaxID=905079 RepID=L1IJV5_GUITC|nr:hypothetical protein GUITHDRAFT_146029 [Guillardia theta CCMP2712]EKX36090.1 hypothetical protein GUITHDRAFT_146029 [Guillardia theta CCMP2712]|eukprot:XP_005823070.1 hypothetical protein GUITHDRAFT_146029 [Guillardia theta CCMP2712]